MEEFQKTERKNVENRGGTKHADATVRCGKWRLYFRHFSFRYFSFRCFATISKIMAPRARVDLPLLKKVELIKDYYRQFSQRDLEAKYKISTGAVCNILKRKQEYLNDFESNQCHEIRRKIKNNLRRKIDEETYSWFVAQRAKNITLSGPTIQEKAR